MRRQPRCCHQEPSSGLARSSEFQKECKFELSSEPNWREEFPRQGEGQLPGSKLAMDISPNRIYCLTLLDRTNPAKNRSCKSKWKGEAGKECRKPSCARAPRQLAIHSRNPLGKSTRSSKWTSRPPSRWHQGHLIKSTRFVLRPSKYLKTQRDCRRRTDTPTNAQTTKIERCSFESFQSSLDVYNGCRRLMGRFSTYLKKQSEGHKTSTCRTTMQSQSNAVGSWLLNKCMIDDPIYFQEFYNISIFSIS